MAATCKFIEETHQYIVNDKKLPSVTEICKPLSIYAAENANPWLRDVAAERGSRAHSFCCDIDFNGGADNLLFDFDCTGYVQAYSKFLRDYQIKSWLGIEIIVFSLGLGIAGTVDRIGLLDGSLLILDIKTGAKIDVALLTAQLMGYEHILLADDCNFKLNVDYDGVLNYGLQLKKDGSYRLFKCEKSAIFSQLHQIYIERERLLCKKSKKCKN